VRGLAKSYGSCVAVAGIDFELGRGEVLALLGPNGAGKTTVVEILEGHRPRDAGEVQVLGVDPATAPRRWYDRIGIVLQRSADAPDLTPREVLRHYSGYYTRGRETDEIIEAVGLGECAGRRIYQLSGGQRRRLDVALGIVGRPELLFLDEPTTGFDPSARREAWNMIEGLKSLGKTIFLTTHYMEEAQHLADRVAILAAGKIVARGRPEELGGGTEQAAVIRFRVPDGVTLEQLRPAAQAPVEIAGSEASIQCEDPQEVLYRLLAWAEREGHKLEALEVQRPSLEDVFLQLTGGAPQPAREVAA
jgi:ABC-2 type transport system ATP-binding protein